MEQEKTKVISLLEGLKEGLENLECVLRQCMPDGDWGLFEENSELQALWQRFRDEIYNGNGKEAVSLASSMLQVIGPATIAANFWSAVKCNDFFPFESKFQINRDRWEEFRKSINSDDGVKIVEALKSYLERVLTFLPPAEPHTRNG